MKKYKTLISIIFIILLIITATIIGFKVNYKKSVTLEFIIVTKSKITLDGLNEIIIDSLKESDPKIKVSVRESSDEVVTLNNSFVGTLNTTLNKDEIIKILSKYKGFKYVQPNYIFKSKFKL